MDNRGKRHTRIISWKWSPMITMGDQIREMTARGATPTGMFGEPYDEEDMKLFDAIWTYDLDSPEAKGWMKENVKDWEDLSSLCSGQYVGNKLRFKCKRCEQWYSTSYSHVRQANAQYGWSNFYHKSPRDREGGTIFPCRAPEEQLAYWHASWMQDPARNMSTDYDPYGPSGC